MSGYACKVFATALNYIVALKITEQTLLLRYYSREGAFKASRWYLIGVKYLFF